MNQARAEEHGQLLNPERIDAFFNDFQKARSLLGDLEAFRCAALDICAAANTQPKGTLTVWYGPMPESNGKSNWTAILHRGDLSEGHTIARSEYPDRVRYFADKVRWLIGELADEPYILAYDDTLHSGYVAPAAVPSPAVGDTAVQQALAALEAAPQPVEHVLPFSNVCDCTQCRAVRATKSALAILRAASQPPG